MSGEQIAWAIAGFCALATLNVVAFMVVFFLTRQGKGENKQQAQGETIATLTTKINGIHESRDKDILILRQEASTANATTERRLGEVEAKLERHKGQVEASLDAKRKDIDDVRNSLSRLEAIVENLAKTVERWVERDERAREPQTEQPTDLRDILRAFTTLQQMGVNLGKAAPASG